MKRKSMMLIMALMMLPGVAMAWTYSATMDSYPSIGGGFSCVNRAPDWAESKVDTSAPGQSRLLHGHFEAGSQSAGEAFSCNKQLGGQYNVVYFQYYFKYASNYEYNYTVDKQLYIETPSVHGSSMIGVRKRSDGLVWPVVFHGGALGQPYRFQNMNTSNMKYISYNTWYKITGEFHLGTSGSSNGWYKIWINDVLTHYYTGIPMLLGGDTGAHEFNFTPVWGGTGTQYAPVGGMDQYFDNLVISSEPISGYTGTITEDKYPNSPSIIKVE